MSTLIATLHAVSGRVRRVFNGQALSENNVNTYLGTWDGSDASVDGCESSGDGVTVGPALAYGVDYILESTSYADPIDFVRVRLRSSMFATGGGNTLGLIQPTLATLARGEPYRTLGAAADLMWGFATDPADGGLWTAAKINAVRLGFVCLVSSDDFRAETFVTVPEIFLEIWVPDGGIDPNMILMTQQQPPLALGGVHVGGGLSKTQQGGK